MVQQTKTRSQQSEVVEETAPDTSRSKEKVEEANCCLSNIDDLLNECDSVLPDPEPEVEVEVPLPSWHPDAEWDVDDGESPEMASFQEVIDYLLAKGIDDSDAVMALYNQMDSTYDERYEQYQEQYLDSSRTSRWGSCTC